MFRVISIFDDVTAAMFACRHAHSLAATFLTDFLEIQNLSNHEHHQVSYFIQSKYVINFRSK